jgi:hypothetical protein
MDTVARSVSSPASIVFDLVLLLASLDVERGSRFLGAELVEFTEG